MKAIDVDPQVLRSEAEAALHSNEQMNVHITRETLDVVPDIIDSLVQDAPIAYITLSEVRPDGTVKLPHATDLVGTREFYEIIHGTLTVLGMECALEIRGCWYTFFEGIAPTQSKATGEVNEDAEVIALFPSTSGKGITGELVWPYRSPSELGRGFDPSAPARQGPKAGREVLRQHERYVEALQKSDIDGILAVLNDDAQGLFRDYVNDTGSFGLLDGKAAHRDYYQAFFDKYELLSAHVLRRVARDWYVFAEIRFEVSARAGEDAGRTLAFNTAESFIPAHDGTFLVRIGHGTDAMPVAPTSLQLSRSLVPLTQEVVAAARAKQGAATP